MSRHEHGSGRWDDRYEAEACVTAVARLSTAVKAFCNCPVDPAAEPNDNTCPVCLGLPGTLPVLNAGAVERAARAALALGAGVQVATGFVRAHHPPTPVQPKGYVVSQRARPLATRGVVQIGNTTAGAPITAAVRAVYLTEDVGRTVHGRFAGASGLDYNLAGAPLLVVDGAPDLRSAAEVRAYVASVAALLRAADASAAELEDGTLSVTLAVAVRKRGDLRAGPACELRGLRSLDDVERAVDAECARQAALLEGGGTVEPRTALWDATTGTPTPMRAPGQAAWELVDPDLPPLLLTAEWIDARRAELPELPPARRERLRREYALDGPALDALTADAELAAYYETAARLHADGPGTARWMTDHVLPLLAREGLAPRGYAVRVRPADLARLLDLRRDGALGDADAVRVFGAMARTGDGVARAAEREGVELDARTKTGKAGGAGDA